MKQNQFWTIKWTSNSTSSNETIPPNKLRTIIESSKENKKLLLDAVLLPSSNSNLSTSDTTNISTNHSSPNNTNTTTTTTDSTNQIRINNTLNPTSTLDPTSNQNSTNTTTNTPDDPDANANTNIEDSTPQRNSVHARFTTICDNIALTSQTTPNNNDESIQQSFWEFESDPDGWVIRNRIPTSTSLTSLMDEAAIDNDNNSISSSSSGEDDVPNTEFSLPDESSFVPRDSTDEFPAHEADDALVDELQQELEKETNLPNLPFKFEEWDEDKHSLDDPPVMAQEKTQFRPEYKDLKRFKSAKSCFEVVTGLDRSFFLHLTKVMNEFGERKKDENGKFANSKWVRFELYEIYRCIGICLRGGITHCAGGGYEAWFVATNSHIIASRGRFYNTYHKQGYDNWAINFTTLRRFRQFLKAFRIENDPDGSKKAADKAYQLRRMCVIISNASRSVFLPGRDLSFDEGGIGCRSRRCPIRMYNKDKPEKYRIDFFILCCSVTYIIFHLEPYQGKNATNAGVTTLARSFPTTAKAVLNAVEKTGLKNSLSGCRVIVMDNRYTSPLLFVALLRHYGIAAIGTVRKNRKGLGKELLTMLKSAEHGACKIYYCKISKILCVQWNDNKVVTVLSTAWLKGSVDIERRVGSQIRTFSTEKCVLYYQQKMLGISKSDQ